MAADPAPEWDVRSLSPAEQTQLCVHFMIVGLVLAVVLHSPPWFPGQPFRLWPCSYKGVAV